MDGRAQGEKPQGRNPVRLQKYLRDAGVESRRKSEELICAGRVAVNGNVVTELGTKVDPERDAVYVDGKPVSAAGDHVVIMLHKPAGVISAMSDAHRPVVADLVPTDRYPGLYHIGRLDADTTGLLLFTNDGDLGNRLLHPRYHVLKRYYAYVEGRPTERELDEIRRGVELDGGAAQPAEARVVGGDEAARMKERMAMPAELARGGSRVYREILRERRSKRCVVELGIREGRYHQVKNMMRAIGHPVVALHRESFGPVELGALPRGSWRVLTADEERALRRACEAPDGSAPPRGA